MTNADTLAQSLAAARAASRISGQKNSYRKDNPGEYAEVIAYLDGGARPTRSLTKMGEHLVLEEDVRRSLVPSQGPAYVTEDWSGLIGYRPWSTIFSYTAPGYLDCGYYGQPARSGSLDGRVSIISNPYGTGKLLRCESRDSDPGWPVVPTLSKSEVSMVKETTWPTGVFTFGMEIWISLELYLPDEFSLASGGSNPFTALAGLHPASSSGISPLELSNYPGSYIQLMAGTSMARTNFIPIDAAHRNRKLSIVLGAKIHPTDGWREAWLDGVNTIPRASMAMCSGTESGPYWKQGFYTASDCSFTGGSVPGRSVVYWGSTSLSTTRPF